MLNLKSVARTSVWPTLGDGADSFIYICMSAPVFRTECVGVS